MAKRIPIEITDSSRHFSIIGGLAIHNLSIDNIFYSKSGINNSFFQASSP
jgi:hypothetical protein